MNEDKIIDIRKDKYFHDDSNGTISKDEEIVNKTDGCLDSKFHETIEDKEFNGSDNGYFDEIQETSKNRNQKKQMLQRCLQAQLQIYFFKTGELLSFSKRQL